VAVVELGMSHAGEISRLVAIAEPDVRVWTNVAEVHLEFFASIEAIADAKAEILEGATSRTALVANADDARVMARTAGFPGALVTFGAAAGAAVRASEIENLGIDGMAARNLDRDDMVTATMNAFCSTTVQCARCHNHKFDPVTQADYYRLQAVFAAVDRADRPYDADPETAARRRQLEQRQGDLTDRKKRLDAEIQRLAGAELEALNRQIAAVHQAGEHQERPEFGYHSQIAPEQNSVKWVQIDLGQPAAIDQIVIVGCHDTFNNIGAGFGFPVRYRIELSDAPEFPPGQTTPVADCTQADVANPGVQPQTVSATGVSERALVSAWMNARLPAVSPSSGPWCLKSGAEWRGSST